MSEWQGDLNDDCWLERYGMLAHVEQLDKDWWWFSVSAGRGAGSPELFNTSNMHFPARLTTGKMARAAAECVMETLMLHGIARSKPPQTGQ